MHNIYLRKDIKSVSELYVKIISYLLECDAV
jgi:hypothetical protein